MPSQFLLATGTIKVEIEKNNKKRWLKKRDKESVKILFAFKNNEGLTVIEIKARP